MDYGRPLSFGYFPSPEAAGLGELLLTVQLADRLGLELVGIQDHPYQQRFLDTWTLIAFATARTERTVFFPDVASLPLRPPAVLAKSAATLDLLSEGRIELGLGSGAYWPGIAAMGGRSLSPGDAVSALEEAIHVIRLMWSGERSARFEGRFYSLGGVRPGPPPAHEMEIWLGAYKPRMLRLTGSLADGWVPSAAYLAPETVADSSARIDEAAAAAGRDPAAIRRVYNVWGLITEDGSTGSGDAWTWPLERWVDVLTRLAVEDGIDSFVFGPAGETERQLHLWAEGVAPGVRANLSAARARG